eukprot:scaffold650_cov249-Pinguiococcus_pyrenoidosus.AAC.17
MLATRALRSLRQARVPSGRMWRRFWAETGGGRTGVDAPSWLCFGAAGAAVASWGCSKEAECQDKPVLHANFIADAVDKALPAVVNVTAGVVSHRGWFPQEGLSAGSGFLIRSDGLVVTNAHVVQGALNGQIHCTLNDGRTFEGSLESLDRASDIALVRLHKAEDLPVAKIGSSAALRVGEWVVALGSPLTLQNSCTAGIVSALARHGSEIGMANGRTDFIQTDAAINIGNSGGPLVNLAGEVVGISTLKAQGTDGIGFAIPMDSAWLVVKSLLKHGRVIRPYIGIKMVAVDPNGRGGGQPGQPKPNRLGLKVMVVEVAPLSPAAKAGVRPGDIILYFRGKPVKSPAQVVERVGLEFGTEIPLSVQRDNEVMELKIVTEAENRRARL